MKTALPRFVRKCDEYQFHICEWKSRRKKGGKEKKNKEKIGAWSVRGNGWSWRNFFEQTGEISDHWENKCDWRKRVDDRPRKIVFPSHSHLYIYICRLVMKNMKSGSHGFWMGEGPFHMRISWEDLVRGVFCIMQDIVHWEWRRRRRRRPKQVLEFDLSFFSNSRVRGELFRKRRKKKPFRDFLIKINHVGIQLLLSRCLVREKSLF